MYRPYERKQGSQQTPDHRPRLCHLRPTTTCQGYGFFLQRFNKNISEHIISDVFPNTPAEVAGLRQYDRIIEVNYVNVMNEHQEKVKERIRTEKGECLLLVLDPEANSHYSKLRKVVTSTNGDVVHKGFKVIQGCRRKPLILADPTPPGIVPSTPGFKAPVPLPRTQIPAIIATTDVTGSTVNRSDLGKTASELVDYPTSAFLLTTAVTSAAPSTPLSEVTISLSRIETQLQSPEKLLAPAQSPAIVPLSVDTNVNDVAFQETMDIDLPPPLDDNEYANYEENLSAYGMTSVQAGSRIIDRRKMEFLAELENMNEEEKRRALADLQAKRACLDF
ncbi:unnamed protein product [Didymodactylos carnosus]|uniref:PDZ domain-containing protein n=1 Tax=Didymodactylos carnosus TaxID=1234261 RepID=A0A8S2Q1I1_9BILA|nr:unnamed protein product [Didymodactylos carnosus]CAF4075934.1 unnamed protein product [Didymodactylos carnosus]